MIDVGYLAAFLGGLLALLSPCSALLLPSLFASAFGGGTRMLARTGVFFLGLAAVMVPLGAGSSGLAVLLTDNRQALITIAGSVIIVLGAVQILGGGWSVGPASRFQQRMAARGTWLSTVGLGAAYGLTGFCSGPILGAVLTVAAAGGNPLRGAALLAVYSLGMAAPLFALAAAWQRFDLGRRRWLRGKPFRVGRVHFHTTSLAAGALFIAIGVGFVYVNGTAALPTLDRGIASKAENTVAGLASHVPDTALLLVLAASIAATVAYRLRHARSEPLPDPADTPPTTDRSASTLTPQNHRDDAKNVPFGARHTTSPATQTARPAVSSTRIGALPGAVSSRSIPGPVVSSGLETECSR